MKDFEGFPGRPDHPDFWKLSDIVLMHDGRMEDASTPREAADAVEKIVAQFIDPSSLTYMALQRALRNFGFETKQDLIDNQDLIARSMALYLDAFAVGAEVATRTNKEEA